MLVEIQPTLQHISNKLKFQIRGPTKVGPFETFLVDLAEWKLSLTDANPCIWVRRDYLSGVDTRELADSLADVVRAQRWQNNTILVFLDGTVPPLRDWLSKVLPTWVIIDEKQQLAIRQTDTPTSIVQDIFLHQATRAQLAPYETGAPVIGNRFFGRRSELNRVLQHADTNYLFTGTLRMGKTSLLKEIQRIMDRNDPPQENQKRRLYVDCTTIKSEEAFLQAITLELAPDEVKQLMRRTNEAEHYKLQMFKRFATLHGSPITIFIDELDKLMFHITDESPLFEVLSVSSSSGKVRFIMAGFLGAMRAYSKAGSAFANFDKEVVQLGRLKRSDVRDMVLKPMLQLRISFQNMEAVVDRISRETGRLPNYVQYYCRILLEQLDEEQRDVISEDDLTSVYDDRDFRDVVVTTFEGATNLLERALLYALTAEDSKLSYRAFSQREMIECLARRRLPIEYETLDTTCRNLEIAGFLNHSGRNYEFGVPLLQRILCETRDPEFLFEQARAEIEKATEHNT